MSKSDVELIKSSGFFDAAWYCAQYPDVSILGMDPAEHYLRFGWLLGRKPSRDFDLSKYGGGDGSRPHQNPVLLALGHHRTSVAAVPVSAPPKPAPVKSPPPAVAPKPAKPAAASGESAGNTLPKSNEKADYDLIMTEFDADYYVRRYPDIGKAKIDPGLHFLRHGGFEGRNPNADFDCKFYLERNPDVKSARINPFLHYLRTGRAEGRAGSPLAAGTPHFDHVAGMLNMTPVELEKKVRERKQDIRARLKSGELGEMVQKAAEYDPLIRHAWLAALNPGISPIRSPGWTHQIAAMHKLQEQAGWHRAKIVILVPWLHMMSGAARSASFLATALAEIYGSEEIVIVRTETSEIQLPDWFPRGCRHIDMAKETQGMETSQKERVLVEFVRSLRPEHVFNVNSRTFWAALEHYGVALSKSVKLHTYLFCNEKNLNGDWVGYPVRNYHKFADILESVMCDSQFLADELAGRFMVAPKHAQRLKVLASPINTQVKPVIPEPRKAGDRPQVYWAGRFDRQKRVDVAFAIAAAMPDVDFHFWGKPTLDKGFEKLQKPDNVTLEGVYQVFDDLPLSCCDAWLYTAEWDGVPNMLLEVASAAVPLVGSIAGGTGEVLIDGLSEPVYNIEDVGAYVAALRRTFAGREEAFARARRLREHILAKHSRETYLQSVAAIVQKETANG